MIDPSKIDKDKTRAHLGGLLRELEAEKAQPLKCDTCGQPVAAHPGNCNKAK